MKNDVIVGVQVHRLIERDNENPEPINQIAFGMTTSTNSSSLGDHEALNPNKKGNSHVSRVCPAIVR
jgi:hypothetical protein